MGKPLLLLTAGNGEHLSVSARASAAAARHGGREYIREVEATAFTPRILTLSDILRGVFTLNMKTKDGDDVRVSMKVVGLLVVLIVPFCGWALYMASSNAALQKDIQNLVQNQRAYEARQDAQQREYQTQIITAMATTDAYISHQTNRIQKLETMLSRGEQRELSEWDSTHPAPPRVRPDAFRPRKDAKPQTNEQQQEEGSQANVRSGM